MLLRCPNSDSLFEYVTIPTEMSRFSRTNMKVHSLLCPPCAQKIQAIRDKWDAYFTPEPDVTASLIKIYGRLQRDETLILKGWKLRGVQRPKTLKESMVSQGWLFRGGVAAGLAAVAFIFVAPQLNSGKDAATLVNATPQAAQLPLARFRVEDKNSIKVHYLQPELLQSMEFETTSVANGR